MSFHDIIGDNAHHILWWQMTIRGVIVFLFALLLLRLFGRRAFGRQNPLDIGLSIIVGADLSRAITGNSAFVPTLIVTAVIVIMFWLFEHAAIRWKLFGLLVKGRPVALIRDGALDRKAMRLWAVSEDDIREAARISGKPGLKAVRDAALERNGKISTLGRSEG